MGKLEDSDLFHGGFTEGEGEHALATRFCLVDRPDAAHVEGDEASVGNPRQKIAGLQPDRILSVGRERDAHRHQNQR
eukprot:2889384-Prymnesium_polylepis.3